MASIFTKIINREIPALIVAEDESHIAFLDINPLVKGHVLVVPKQEVDYVFDLEDAVLSNLLTFSKKVAKKIQNVVPCNRIGVSIVGLEVPHAHVHLIPIDTVEDMNFGKDKPSFSNSDLTALAEQIAKA